MPHMQAGQSQSLVDILPDLKAGGSYGTLERHRIVPDSLRWVPAADGITAPFTSQARRACPALQTLIAPTTTALSSKPHATHSNRACVWWFFAATWL